MISNFKEYQLLTESLSMTDLSIDKIKALISKFKDKNKALEYLISSFNKAKNKGMKKNIAKLLIVMYFIGFATKNNRWVDTVSASEMSEVTTSMSEIENMTERELQDFMGDKTYLYDKSETETGVDAPSIDKTSSNLSDTDYKAVHLGEESDSDYDEVQAPVPMKSAEYVNVKKLSVSQGTIDFIKKHEKLRLTAYSLTRIKRDKKGKAVKDDNGENIRISDGMVTIGYGHAEPEKKSKYKVGDKISESKADRLFRKDLRTVERGVKRIFRDWAKEDIDINITQSMYDAMVSMTYNMGVSGLRTSVFIQHMKKGDFVSASKKIKTSRLGKFRGVKKRRESEYKIFIKDIS